MKRFNPSSPQLLPIVALLAASVPGAACGAPAPAAAPDFSMAQTVEVRLSNFAFTPDTITLKSGRPYVLRLIDTASGGHNFNAPKFFAAAQVSPEDAGKIAKGRVELKANQAETIQLVPAAGTYKLTCTHFGHTMFGMTGKIVVR